MWVSLFLTLKKVCFWWCAKDDTQFLFLAIGVGPWVTTTLVLQELFQYVVEKHEFEIIVYYFRHCKCSTMKCRSMWLLLLGKGKSNWTELVCHFCSCSKNHMSTEVPEKLWVFLIEHLFSGLTSLAKHRSSYLWFFKVLTCHWVYFASENCIFVMFLDSASWNCHGEPKGNA